MRVSIIIASHNEGDGLWKTVQSCLETCDGLDYEIVVVDDASTDDSVDEMLRRFPSLRATRLQERMGPSPPKDLGARRSTGEVLVFLDAHCKPESGAIERLVADVEEADGEIIVTPRVAALDVDRWISQLSLVGTGYSLNLLNFDPSWINLDDMQSAGRFYESPSLIGCSFAIARTVYEALQGFDPDMRIWGVEDVDLALKGWLMGYRVLHDPEPLVGHRFQANFDRYEVPTEHIVANKLRMACKNFTTPAWREWLDDFRAHHDAAVWDAAWTIFSQRRGTAERERAYLLQNRVYDEYWFAAKFGMPWPSKKILRIRR